MYCQKQPLKGALRDSCYALVVKNFEKYVLNFSWQRSLSYRNQSNDFYSKSMDWFLYDRYLRHERGKDVRRVYSNISIVNISDKSRGDYTQKT